jgi:hypothetical protein
MSLILRTVQAFPRGRSTEDILVLVGAGFSHDKRVAALAELGELHREGYIEKGRDGLWRPSKTVGVTLESGGTGPHGQHNGIESEMLFAAAATFRMEPIPEPTETEDANEVGPIDPQALLRYWRSALRADPRGATTQVTDKHAFEWALISGQGPMVPGLDETLTISVSLDGLSPTFREALVRREGHENVLAVGWPLAVGRNGGVPIFQPVGLLAAVWQRTDETLILTVDADDVLVNPEWIRTSARASSWNKGALEELFDAADGVGLPAAEFVARLRDAVARQIRGRIVGKDLASQLDPTSQGIFDSAALFLPTDSSFTAGAARDLDTIATWPRERLARTALAPVFQLEPTDEARKPPVINVGPVNGEQLAAVRHACEAPLTRGLLFSGAGSTGC